MAERGLFDIPPEVKIIKPGSQTEEREKKDFEKRTRVEVYEIITSFTKFDHIDYYVEKDHHFLLHEDRLNGRLERLIALGRKYPFVAHELTENLTKFKERKYSRCFALHILSQIKQPSTLDYFIDFLRNESKDLPCLGLTLNTLKEFSPDSVFNYVLASFGAGFMETINSFPEPAQTRLKEIIEGYLPKKIKK